MAVHVTKWAVHAPLRLMIPCTGEDHSSAADRLCTAEQEAADHPPAVAFIETADALSLKPWPGDTLAQQGAHDASVAATGAVDVRGYASWISPQALETANPIVVRETSAQMGTRIWEASWLFRLWALQTPSAFPSGSRVLELGCGCGLVGISVAAAHAVHVTLSDFEGHCRSCKPTDSVLHNLRLNAEMNRELVASGRGQLRVVELDWAQPECPMQCELGTGGPPRSSCDGGEAAIECVQACARCTMEPADVILAAECLYSEEGTTHFLTTLARWLAPGATSSAYVLNNAMRIDVPRFERACAAHGLHVERLPSLRAGCGVMNTFMPPWDEDDHYTFLKLTWAEDARIVSPPP